MEKIYSTFYYPIEYYNPHVHLECNDFNTIGPNEAEIKALKQEEFKNNYAKIKELRQKEFIKKCNKSALLYQEENRMKNKEEQLNKNKEKNEQLLKRQNYNKIVYQKNMKPFLKERELKEKAKTLKKEKEKKTANKEEIKIINKQPRKLNNLENEFIPQEDNYMNESENIENKELIDNLEGKENLKNAKDEKINNLNNEIVFDNDVIDLRVNLENQLFEELKKKNDNKSNNNEIRDEVYDKINTIRRFREYGYFPDKAPINGVKNKKKAVKNKKFVSEYEKRRFIKALKNIITERLGEHNIYIQNICSCGNLQKKLSALVENGNLTVYALTDVECANNCVFYKNKKAYLKSINDVLKSIKDIAYENFHNKYKDEK